MEKLIRKPGLNQPDLALVDCFSKATWVALSAAVVFLSIDAYAMFYVGHHRAVIANDVHQGPPFFSVLLWSVEIAIAILSFWLLYFAFTRPPELPHAS